MPPIVLITSPVTFKACTSTPPNKTNPSVVEPTPFSTPTIVVVKAEFTIVHKNMVKLRMIPITNERMRTTKNVKDSSFAVSKAIASVNSPVKVMRRNRTGSERKEL